MKKTIIITLAAAAILAVSCDKYLSAPPTQTVVDENLVHDAGSAESALNGVYYVLNQCGTDYNDVLCADPYLYIEEIPSMFANITQSNSGDKPINTHSQTAEDHYASSLWSYYYSVLAAANGFITNLDASKGLEDLTDAHRAELRGQALTIRAYMHLCLLRDFGYHWDVSSPYGALLRTEKMVTGTISKARSTVAESYDCILKDLDEAIDECPATNGNHYINKWVAKGYKARVLMMRGQGRDYSDAAAICKDIIDNSGYKLDNMFDLFQTKGLDSPEVMFGLKPKVNQTSKYVDSYYRFQINHEAVYCVRKVAFDLFYGDPRADWAVTYYGLSKGSLTYGYTGSGVGLTKYIDKSTMVATATEETCYYMRLTEFYLMRAEALAHIGENDAEARTLLETVMTKAGVTDFSAVSSASGDELLAQIYYEVIRNMCSESGRELEVMFRVPESAVETFCPTISQKATMCMPIPLTELQKNPTIGAQNPGYNAE